MKEDYVRVALGVGIIAGVAFVVYKVHRRTTEGTVARMKAPFKSQLLPYPVTSDVVSSHFGMRGKPPAMHFGIDLKTRFSKDAVGDPVPDPKGDIILANAMLICCPFDGVVSELFSDEVGGFQMVVKSTDGHRMGLAHLSPGSAHVKKGQPVTAGDPLALAGESGKVTGPHIHLSVRTPDGTLVDPAPYLGL